MHFFPEIIPLFEAYAYLTKRFSSNRTSDIIKHFEPRKDDISHERWTYFDRIYKLQTELDEALVSDELMERYFRQLRVHAEMPGDRALTLGGLLLRIPPQLESPFGFDALVSFYENAEQNDLLDHFYSGSLAPFFNDNTDLASVNMSRIVSMVNKMLVETEDKWALIDCISNPCEHLELLRPLVERVIGIIKERSRDFSSFLNEEAASLSSKGLFANSISELMRTEIKQKDLSDAQVYFSLFSFNGIDMSYKQETFEINRIIFGIFLNVLLELRGKSNNADLHIQMLKMLSDPTRFKVLHELCGRQSYGQELADKFGGARSAIYYHLEKLLGYGLIDLEMTEYRMLYTMNKQNVYDKMNAIRDYLLDGWKPEPKQEKEEKEE